MSWLTPGVIDILIAVGKALVILLVVVGCGAFMSFAERRLLGLFQNRYGPNRVGWGGSLQLVADMIKMFFKGTGFPLYRPLYLYPGAGDCFCVTAAGVCHRTGLTDLGRH